MAAIFYICAQNGDAEGIIDTINNFADGVFSKLDVSPDGKFIVGETTADREGQVSDIMADLAAEQIHLRRAPSKSARGVNKALVVEALNASEHASLATTALLHVSGEGVIWAVSIDTLGLILQAVTDKQKSEALAHPPLDLQPNEESKPQAEEFTVTLTSIAIKEPPTTIPPKWIDFFKEHLRTAKNAASYNFTGRVALELKGGTLELTAYFKDLDGANNFSMSLRSSKLWQCQVKEPKQTMIKFELTDANPVVQSHKIDTVEDITAGVAAGNATAVGWRVGGDVSVLSGPTQAGKSTTISGIAGRQVVVATSKNDLKVVEGINPLVHNAKALQAKYVIVKRQTHGTVADLPKGVVADRRNEPLLAGVALPDSYEIVTRQHLESVLESGQYDVVPDEAWGTIPDVLAVAKEQVGCSTTTDIYAYDVHGAAFQIVLDTPGTHDTRGLLIDVRNTMVRLKALRQCSSIRLAIVVDFQQVSSAGGQTLGEFLAPVACMLKDYEKSLADCAVLFTRVVPAMQLREGTADSYKAELIAWIKSAIAQITGLVDSTNSAVMKDKYAGPLLKYAVDELRRTRDCLVDGVTTWGKATVVHPLMSPDAYLTPVMSAAKALSADAFRASLGPKGSAGLGRCLDLRLRQFTHSMRNKDERDALALAAGLYRAIMELEDAEVHFTEDAKWDTVQTDMTNLLRDHRVVQTDALRAAVKAGDLDASRKCLEVLRASDDCVSNALLDETEAVRARVTQSLKVGTFRPAANQCALQIANEEIGQSNPAAEAIKALDGANVDLLQTAVTHLTRLHLMSQICSGGGAAAIEALVKRLRQVYEAECKRIGAGPKTDGVHVSQTNQRNAIASLTSAATSMRELAGITNNGIAGLTVDWVASQRKQAFDDILAGLKGIRQLILEGFNTTANVDAKDKVPKATSEQLQQAAASLKSIGEDADIARALEASLSSELGPNDKTSLSDFLYGPFKLALKELKKDPLRGANVSDPVYLATRVLPQLQAKLQANRIFATSSDELSGDVVTEAGKQLTSFAARAASNFADLVESLNTQASSASLSRIPDSEYSDDGLSRSPSSISDATTHTEEAPAVSKALHTLVAIVALADELVASGHPDTLRTTAQEVVANAWKSMAKKMQAFATKAQTVHRTSSDRSLSEYVVWQEVLHLVERCRPIAQVYGCGKALLKPLEDAHLHELKRVADANNDLIRELEGIIATMAVSERVPYKDAALWLRQLEQIVPSRSASSVMHKPVRDAAQTKRRDIVTNIKLRHNKLAADIAAARGAGQVGPNYDAIFTAILGEGLRMEYSGVLDACRVTRSLQPGELFDFTAQLEGCVEDLCQHAKSKVTDKALTTVNQVTMLFSDNMQYANANNDQQAKFTELLKLLKRCANETSTLLTERSVKFTNEIHSGTRLSESSLLKSLQALGPESQRETISLIEQIHEEKLGTIRLQVRKVLNGSVDDCPDVPDAFKRATSLGAVLDIMRQADDTKPHHVDPNAPQPSTAAEESEVQKTKALHSVQTLLDKCMTSCVGYISQQDWASAMKCITGIRNIESLDLSNELRFTYIAKKRDESDTAPQEQTVDSLFSHAVQQEVANLTTALETTAKSQQSIYDAQITTFLNSLDGCDGVTGVKKIKTELRRTLAAKQAEWSTSEETNQKTAEFLRDLTTGLNHIDAVQLDAVIHVDPWPERAKAVLVAWSTKLGLDCQKNPLRCVSSLKRLVAAEYLLASVGNKHAEDVKKELDKAFDAIYTTVKDLGKLTITDLILFDATLPKLHSLRVIKTELSDAIPTNINDVLATHTADFIAITEKATRLVSSPLEHIADLEPLHQAVVWIQRVLGEPKMCIEAFAWPSVVTALTNKMDEMVRALGDAAADHPEAVEKIVNKVQSDFPHGAGTIKLRKTVKEAVQLAKQGNEAKHKARAAIKLLTEDPWSSSHDWPSLQHVDKLPSEDSKAATTTIMEKVTTALHGHTYSGFGPLLKGLSGVAACQDLRERIRTDLLNHVEDLSHFDALSSDDFKEAIQQLRLVAKAVKDANESIVSTFERLAGHRVEKAKPVLRKSVPLFTEDDFALVANAVAECHVLDDKAGQSSHFAAWDASAKRNEIAQYVDDCVAKLQNHNVEAFLLGVDACAVGSIALSGLEPAFTSYVAATKAEADALDLSTPRGSGDVVALFARIKAIHDAVVNAKTGKPQRQSVCANVSDETVVELQVKTRELLASMESVIGSQLRALPRPTTYGNLRSALNLASALKELPKQLQQTHEETVKSCVLEAVNSCQQLGKLLRVALKESSVRYDGEVKTVLNAMEQLDGSANLLQQFNEQYGAELAVDRNHHATMIEHIKDLGNNINSMVAQIQIAQAADAEANLVHWAGIGAQLTRFDPAKAPEVVGVAHRVRQALESKIVETAEQLSAKWGTVATKSDSLKLDNMLNVLQHTVEECTKSFPGQSSSIQQQVDDVKSKICATLREQVKASTKADDDEMVKTFVKCQEAAQSVPFLRNDLTAVVDEELGALLQSKPDKKYRATLFQKFKNLGKDGESMMSLGSFKAEAARQLAEIMDKISPEDAVNKKMKCFGITDHEKDKLIKRVTHAMGNGFTKLLDDTYAVAQRSTFEDSKRWLKDLILQRRQAVLDSMAASDLHLLLVTVAFSYTWFYTGQDYEGSRDVLRKPHAIQMGAIMRLLNLDGLDSQSAVLTELTKKARDVKSSDMYPGHMVEVLTGQGKSVTLGILTCVLALLGRYVDVVCYSQQLTDRDATDLKPFFEFMGVMDRVTYLTFQGVMERRAGGVREAVLEVAGAQVPPAVTRTERDDCPERRVLLVDEVDVLFAKEFFGELYNATARYASTAIKAIIQYVFDHQEDDLALNNAVNQQVVADACAAAPELANYIRQQVGAMTKQVKDYGRPAQGYDPTRPQDYIVDADKGIGYYDSDGTINFKMAPQGHWYKPAFAFLKEAANGDIKDDTAARLSLPLSCPGFAYSNLPRQCYCAVFGVTGTLQTLSPAQTDVLKSLCNVAKQTYTQSVYAQTSAIWSVGNTIMVPAGPDEEQEWLRAIERCITEVPRGFPQSVDGTSLNLPVVVIFESAKYIQQFLDAFPQYKDECQIIDRNTPPSQVENKVACATTNSMLTLVDRAFGRGTDFKCKMCLCLTVIQTFLPETLSEEVQIRGRTGRQGERGSVKVILRPSQVAPALAPPEGSGLPSYGDDVSVVKTLFDQHETGNEFAFLQTRQEIESRGVRNKEAAARNQLLSDQAATNFINTMFDTTLSQAQKLQVLLEACRVGNKHVARPAAYLFILDASGSMSAENRWTDLKAATSATLELLHRTQPSAFVIIVVFGSGGQAYEFTHGNARDIPSNCLDKARPKYGTEYFDAFTVAANSVTTHQAALAPRALHVLFMTDGEDGPAKGRPVSSPVETLLKAHDVSAYYYVLFGSSIRGTNPSIEAIDSKFKQYNVVPQQRTAAGLRELTAAFEEIVQSGNAY